MSQFWQSLQGLRSRILPFAQRTLIFRRVSSFKLLLISEQKRDYNVALIGLGWRGYRTHFLSLVDSPSVSVVAVCDTDQNTLQSFSAQHPTIHTYSSITQLLQHHTLDFAVLSVPHAFHLDCVVALSEKGVPILKEKPVAESCDEYSQMRNFSVPIGITFQKRFEPQFLHLKSLLPLIGDATAIQASLTLNITHLDENWRADTGVGVTEDLGCHMLDLVVWLFGMPTSVMARCVSSVRPFQQYGGDDVSHVIMDWRPKNCIAHVYMSRVAHKADQTITITGAKGTLTVDGSQVIHHDDEGHQLSKTVHHCIEKNVIRKMVLEFGDWISGYTQTFSTSLANSQDTVLVVDAIKASLTSRQVQHPLLLSKQRSSITTERKRNLLNTAPGRGYKYSTSASPVESVKRFTLNTGSTIPIIGLGTRRAQTPGEVRDAVNIALRTGYRHIDIAESSGNEREIAEAIKDSGISRSEIWITTKLDNRWHTRVDQAVERSLKELDTTFIDLYLMHWPICSDPDNPTMQLPNWNFIDTWKELQKISRNQVRNIGVSNFGIMHLEALLVDPSCYITPAVNQIELHPYWPSPNLLNYCRENGIHCTAYSPFGSSHAPLLQDSVLREISRLRNRTEHQILLKWGIQRGTSVIPRSLNDLRIKENIHLNALELTENDMNRLNSMTSRYKSCVDYWLPGRVFFPDDT